ncbi:MAG: lipoprotein-releasing system permease protein [Limisphaerales bacterium]|nr:MAG: lipoprotein-releasing system permease protein [Limisphaerales bacterium]KAG0509268.1 MAG: lipoprotein-releasing system permease protein [Limisphaerales bacterium]TXT52193.1 MAG: lipoprotein-releasing system permease protein [Limisphaerales bacterium]
MSRLPFELLLALRYLRPKRTFVSVITLISVIGVMLGVAVLIIVISVMSGFDRQLREKLLGFNAHLRVIQPGELLSNREEIMARIMANPRVKGVAPFVQGKVLLETQPPAGGSLVDAPVVRGVDAQREGGVSDLPKSIKEGEFNLRGNGLVLGRELAANLGLRVGDRVSIYSPANLKKLKDSRRSGKEEAVMPDEYTVKGIFDVGYYEFNANVVVTSLANAQDLYELEDNVHGLQIRLHDPSEAEAARKELQRTLGSDYLVRTWMDDSAMMLGAIEAEKNVMFIILFFVIIVASFGITSGQISFVLQKTREIGVLKALGATSGQVRWLFLIQSLIVGLLGVIAGFALGLLALHYRNEFLDLMNSWTGRELFPRQIYAFDRLPMLIVPSDIAIICGGSLFICLLAGLLPAWNAGRLQPVEALRNE